MNETLSKPLSDAYDIDAFEKVGHQLIDFLGQHLRKCKEGNSKVITYVEPEDEYAYWADYEMESPMGFYEDLISRTIHTHHRRYIGHQVSAPALISSLSGLVSELLNAGMGIYEMGAAATALEKIVIQKFCQKVGFGEEEGDGFLTSGGTLANLTALLAARASLGENQTGREVILESDQAHFCIDRAAMTMGMNTDQVVKIPSTADYTIDIDKLKKSIFSAQESDQKIMAIVGCACSTSTGSYDDLEALADLCEEHDIWLHVDGAHGGAAAWSEKYSHVVSGMSRAQSVIIDAHKMMMTPALATAVLFKQPSDSYKALSIKADYLWKRSDGEWYLLAKRTYETTKLMMSVKIYSLLKMHGHQVIDDFVTRQYDYTRYFANEVAKKDNLELAHQPMSNIVCFRYLPDGRADANEVNNLIRAKLLESGVYYIVQTVLHEKTYLRITIMSPFTEKNDLDHLINLTFSTGKQVEKSLNQ